jgi:transcription initiation factor IIE alpha subunit
MFPNATVDHRLGSFVHESGKASSPHDPIVTLASKMIRSYWGASAQAVADCLQVRGHLSFPMIMKFLTQHQHSKCVKIKELDEDEDLVLTRPYVRAALIALLQHDIVTAIVDDKKGQTLYEYSPLSVLPMLHCARMIEYISKAVGPMAACCMQELALVGRMRTIDLVVHAAERAPKSAKYTGRKAIMEALYVLVQHGFIEKAPEVKRMGGGIHDDDADAGEHQFGEEEGPAKKKVKMEPGALHNAQYENEDPACVVMLQNHAQYLSTLPVNAVWRVNMKAVIHRQRANALGKLVSCRHDARIQYAGAFVTAALKHRAELQHGAKDPNYMVFNAVDMQKYLPKTIVQALDKKAGGVQLAIKKTWQELETLKHPAVVRRVGDTLFEIQVTTLVAYLRRRVVHQVIFDHQGVIGARIVSILHQVGYQESDKLAEMAMAPAKDIREILHGLYRKRYIENMGLSTRQYAPAQTTYLWGVNYPKLVHTITDNVLTALVNIRLRREHEILVGSHWIERTKQKDDIDENDHEADKINYQKFCLGLERLDVAASQLELTLMILLEY